MPISFHVDRLGRRVVTRASGLVTFSELSEHLDAEERQRALDLTELFDARGATTDITPDQIKQLVRRAAEAARRAALGPTAIVTHDDLESTAIQIDGAQRAVRRVDLRIEAARGEPQPP